MTDTKEDSVAAPSEGKSDASGLVPFSSLKLGQVVLGAVVAIAFTAIFMVIYINLTKIVWPSDFVAANRWLIPVGVLFFSLIVGLAQRYLKAPNMIHGSITDALKGKEEVNYRTFPGALVSALASLLSGACVGPEGCITVLVTDVSAYLRSKLKVSAKAAPEFDAATLASAFNGIIGNPLFTGVFATEYSMGTDKPNAISLLAWNLLAGVIGYVLYLLMGLPSFANALALTPIQNLNLVYILYAIIIGVVGSLIAIFAGVSMQFFGKFMERVFKNRIILRIMAAGVVIAIVGYFIPEIMFSGEEQIYTIIANAAQYGVALLLLFAVLKILLLALSFKSGFLGGPIFPVLFSCTMVAYALGLLFPAIPLSLLVTGIEASAFTLAMGAPLTAILLVVVVNTTDPYALAIIVLATVVGILMGFGFKRLTAQRAAKRVTGQKP